MRIVVCRGIEYMILVTECKLEIKSRKNRERNYRETERMVVDASASVLNTLCLLSNSLPYLWSFLRGRGRLPLMPEA